MEEKKQFPPTYFGCTDGHTFPEGETTFDMSPIIRIKNERMAEAFVRMGSKRTKEEILEQLNQRL